MASIKKRPAGNHVVVRSYEDDQFALGVHADSGKKLKRSPAVAGGALDVLDSRGVARQAAIKMFRQNDSSHKYLENLSESANIFSFKRSLLSLRQCAEGLPTVDTPTASIDLFHHRIFATGACTSMKNIADCVGLSRKKQESRTIQLATLTHFQSAHNRQVCEIFGSNDIFQSHMSLDGNMEDESQMAISSLVHLLASAHSLPPKTYKKCV